MTKFYLITLFFCFAFIGNLFALTPIISSFSPTSGPVGTIVTINGNNLNNLTALNIGNFAAIVVSNNGTKLVGMVMPGATTGAISATTSTGTASGPGYFNIVNTPLPNTQQGNKLVGSNYTGAAQQGYAVAVSADGNTAVVGAPEDNNLTGAVWVYTRTNGSWTQQGPKLVGTGYVGQSYQGCSVALAADGNTLLVGGYRDNYFGGSAWVFTRSNGVWTQQGSKLSGAGAVGGLQEGFSVAISADGNTAAVGANVGNGVWVFTRSGGTWTQQGAKISGTGNIGSAWQGSSVALSADGNTMMVGGTGDNLSSGATWAYTRTNGIWTQQGDKIPNPENFNPSMFGNAIALSADGNVAVVGGKTNNNNIGAAWVFVRSNGAWTQQGDKLAATDTGLDSYVGCSVGISADGNLIMVGGYGDYSNTGAVWAFLKNGASWTPQGSKLIGSGNTGAAQHGQSLALSADGNTLISGGNKDNTGVGGVWVFTACAITETLPATLIKATDATLNGSVSDNSNSTAVSFEYGTAADLKGSVTVPANGKNPLPAGAGKSIYTAALNNLTLGTTYYFRINGISNNGASHGAILNFKTVAGAPSIKSFTPLNGQPGTLITINGTNLDNPTGITIGGTSAIAISNTGTQLVVMAMPGSTSGQLSIATPGGTAIAAGNFTVLETPYPNVQQGGKFVGSGVVVGTSGNADQGGAVAISADGNTAVVGGVTDNSQAGAIWIFFRTNGVWAQQGPKLTAIGGGIGSRVGVSVAISADGNTVIAGGNANAGNLGAAWIFVRNGVTWSQQGSKLIGTGNVGYAEQGTAVALSADGNTAVSYGNADNNNQGAVWVFNRNGTTWSQQGAKLPAATEPMPLAEPGNQALAISADGNTILIGNIQDNNWQGSALVYSKTGNTWSQQGDKLIGTGNVGAARQGASVALSADGNIALIGGYNDNSQEGAAWVFTRKNAIWTQQGNKLEGTGVFYPGAAQQGHTVALSADGSTAAVGGPYENSGFVNSGAIWVFKQSNGTWSQTKTLRLTGATSFPQQSSAMGLSADGTTIISGAPHDNKENGGVWFFYASNSAPVITSFSPSTAKKEGVITITGTNFTGATSVTFGGVAAHSFTVVSPTSITAVVGTGASGNIVITTPGGTTTFAGFNFVPVPIITANGPLTFNPGGNVVLTANPGTGYSFQWLKDGVNINGATNASFTASQSGKYTVSITLNSVSSVSNATVVNVVNIPAPTITASGPLNFPPGGSVVLSSSTGPGYTYQWAKDGIDINGATSSSYNATQAGSYTVTVSLSGVSNTSTKTVVTVQSGSSSPEITITGTLSDLTTIYGTASSSTNFSVSGTNLTTGVTVTAPAGFEVSSDNVNFSNQITFGSAGTLNSTTIYIRLAASTSVGSYIGDISLRSGTASANIPMVYSMVALPVDNYKITINSATCRGSDNGSVNITASQTLDYVATISGNGISTPYSFTKSVGISNLAAGSYSICITVEGQPSYQQCYNVTISEPQDLTVYSTVNSANNTVSLALTGAAQYNIELNGKQYTTTNNSITLPLTKGSNDLTVSTDKLCQGVIQKIINLSGILAPYPNPFQNVLALNIGDKSVNNLTVEIQTVTDGRLVYSKQYVNQSGVLRLDLSNLMEGTYILQLSMDNSEQIFKILKK